MGRQQERGTQNAFWALTSAESAQFDNRLRPACGFVLPLFCDSPVMCLSLAERTVAGSVFCRPRLASGENNLQEIPMSQFTKPWKDLTFTDNFIFCKVMEDEVLCRRMIEILLGINVSKIEYLATEKQIENYYDARGVRLDVYVKDSDRIFNLELQTGNYDDLLLRSRYYQSASDVATTKRRTQFRKLKETFIIFLCIDDPFKAGLPVYTKKLSFAETDSVIYDDKTHNVFYNASAWQKAGSEELRNVLRFVYESRADSDYTKALERSSAAAKARSEWEVEYMYVMDIIEDEKELAREEGHAEGKAEGRAEGLEEGRVEARLKTARNLLAEGIPLATVLKCTGLSEEDLKEETPSKETV